MAFAVWKKNNYISFPFIFMKKSNIVYFREESCRYFRAKKKKHIFKKLSHVRFMGRVGEQLYFHDKQL